MDKQKTKIFIHSIGWIAFLFIPLFFYQPRPDNPNPDLLFIISSLVSGILMIGFFYLNSLIFFPNQYLKGRYTLYLLNVLTAFLLICVIILTISHFFRPPNQEELFRPPPPTFPLPLAGNLLFRFLIVLFLSCAMTVNARWKKTEEEKMKAEVSYLKAQINPHFLFNTLNSIYSLSIKKSDETSNAIIKLSNIMRYVVSDATHEFVSVEKEIDYIKSYIELQKLRLTSSIIVQVEINIENPGKRIAPMLLIPFIENAFKHGVNTEENCFISIRIELDTNELHLIVENKKVAIQKQIEEYSGLGIQNSKNRLNLIYPSKHTLNITNGTNTYTVDLKINLQ
jgi:sensor histidine kinase YesM